MATEKPPAAGPLRLAEILRRTAVGDSVYLTQESSVIAAYAASVGVKVKTAKLLVIHVATKDLTDMTRVTIVSRDAPTSTPALTEAPGHATRPARRSRTTG